MLSTVTLLFLSSIISLLYLWIRHNYSYWKRNGIPSVKPTPFIGNIKEVLQVKNSLGLHFADIYNDKKVSSEAVVGFYAFAKPVLLIRDLELIKSILIKDFHKFSNRYSACDPHGDPLAANNLFFARNPYWKEMRTKITPVFTSGKMKQMYPLMQQVGHELEAKLKEMTKDDHSFEAEMKDLCSLFTTDVIASIAFGIQANSLKNPNGQFREFTRAFFNFSSLSKAFDFFVIFMLPKMVHLFRIKMFTPEFAKFMRDTINFTINQRKQSGIVRNDIIDTLINLKQEDSINKISNKEILSEDFLIAQAAIFLTAGFETSSSTMSFTLYELSKRPVLQTRLRNEITEALLKDEGKITYETINSMEFLSMVVNETLRLYPVLPFLDRQFEGNKGDSEYSLKPHYDYKLPNGMPVYIPIYAIQRDPKYWSNPNTFDPDRFSKKNEKNIHPMTYLPFGVGPHNCIGNRLGLLQAKMGLVHILKNHHVEPCDKTLPEMILDPKGLLLNSLGGIYLKMVNDNLYEQKIN